MWAPMALTSRSAPASDGFVDAHLDAEVDVLADHQRLDVQVAPRQVAQVEERLRHHAGDDAGVQVRQRQGRPWPAAGPARRRIRRRCARLGGGAPLGDPVLAVVHGEQGVGVALFDGQQHRPQAPPKKTSPAVMRRTAPSGKPKPQRAVGVQPLGDADARSRRPGAPCRAAPGRAARSVQASAMSGEARPSPELAPALEGRRPGPVQGVIGRRRRDGACARPRPWPAARPPAGRGRD